jgi:hypothetical protein
MFSSSKLEQHSNSGVHTPPIGVRLIALTPAACRKGTAMRLPPEIHGIEFVTARDLHGRRVRLAIGYTASGGVALAFLKEGEPLLVNDGTVVAALAPAEVPALQRELRRALEKAAERQD